MNPVAILALWRVRVCRTHRIPHATYFDALMNRISCIGNGKGVGNRLALLPVIILLSAQGVHHGHFYLDRRHRNESLGPD